MKKIIITGATSMIGSGLIDALKNDCYIYALVHVGSKKTDHIVLSDNVKIIELNQDKYDELPKYIFDQIDWVFHLSWAGARNPYRNDAVLQKQNYEATLSLFESVKKLGATCFVGAGSQAEYGKCYDKPMKEDMETCPDSEYGKYKNKAFCDLNELAEANNIRLLWPRIFSAYGRFDFPNTLIMQIIKKLSNMERIDLSPCEHIWNFTYYKDIVRGLIFLANMESTNGVYNLSVSENIPLKVYVEQIKSILKTESAINYGYYPYNNGIIPNMAVDNSKLMSLGFKFNYSFEQGMKELLKDENIVRKD